MSKPEKPKKKKKKDSKIKYAIWGGIALIAIVLWWGFQPYVGTIHFGICRTYASLKLRYPETMKLTETYMQGNTQTIHFSYVDGFGYKKSEMVQCVFDEMDQTGLTIKEIYVKTGQTRKRQRVPDEDVALFNASIPAIVAAGPDLVIPALPGRNLIDLKQD